MRFVAGLEILIFHLEGSRIKQVFGRKRNYVIAHGTVVNTAISVTVPSEYRRMLNLGF
jgi:hypothetical protein